MLPHPNTPFSSRLTVFLLCLLIAVGAPAISLADTGDSMPASVAGRAAPAAAGDPSGIATFPRLGIESWELSVASRRAEIASVGVGWVRTSVSWSDIEPNNTDPANYNWAATDSLFATLAQNRIAPLVLMLGCPRWACPSVTGPLYDDKYGEFAQFMGAMAARYKGAPYNVHYWELFNEPDGAGGPDKQWGWGQHADKYAAMLSQVYPAVKSADSMSVVMTGGLAYDFFFDQGGPFNKDFLPNLLRAGGGQYLDAVAFHHYQNNAHGWTNIGIKTNAIRAIMNQNGVDLPLISTETGLTSSPAFGSSEEIQARYVVQMTAQGAAAGLLGQSWYVDKDYPNANPTQDVFSESGLSRLDNTRKPSYTAMQVFSNEIGSGAYLGKMNGGDGISGSLEGYRFATPTSGRQTSVVWNNKDGQTTWTVPAAQAAFLLRVVDLYGQPVDTRPGAGGTRLVNVSPDPVYLDWRTARYTDVPLDAWSYEYIEYLAAQGIVSGYSAGDFRPNNPATRGQFSKMIALGMGWPQVIPSTASFVDVPPSNSFYGYIETIYSRRLVSGYACGTPGEPCPGVYFRPGDNVSRGQIAKIITLAKGWPALNPSSPTFSDVSPTSTFYTYIETAAARGIISGPGDGSFRPELNATRAQLSKMLALSLQQP